MIILSSLKLAINTYNNHFIFAYFDYIFSLFFTLESIVKIISLGLIWEKGSYLRNYWNIMDFFIVISSIIDMASENVKIPIIKVYLFINLRNKLINELRFLDC